MARLAVGSNQMAASKNTKDDARAANLYANPSPNDSRRENDDGAPSEKRYDGGALSYANHSGDDPDFGRSDDN